MYVEGKLKDISFKFEYMPSGSFNLDVSKCSVTLELTELKTDITNQKELKELTRKKIYITTELPRNEWKLFTDELPPKNTKILMKDLFDNIHVGVFANGGSILSSTGELLRAQVFYWKSID